MAAEELLKIEGNQFLEGVDLLLHAFVAHVVFDVGVDKGVGGEEPPLLGFEQRDLVVGMPGNGDELKLVVFGVQQVLRIGLDLVGVTRAPPVDQLRNAGAHLPLHQCAARYRPEDGPLKPAV